MYDIDLRYHSPAGQISAHSSGEHLSEVLADVLRRLKQQSTGDEKLDRLDIESSTTIRINSSSCE